MTNWDRLIGQVWRADARDLLGRLPPAVIDAIITDAMYGASAEMLYDWGYDPARGDPDKHWRYHEPLYKECLRVLKAGGILSWGQGLKFAAYFDDWFGPHRRWYVVNRAGMNFCPNVWIVQRKAKEREPVQNPNHMIVDIDLTPYRENKKIHPCPKPVEEMEFFISHLTKPGDLILDPFVGTGQTILAAERLGRRWIACDISRIYCQRAMKQLDDLGRQMQLAGQSGGQPEPL
jgi:site-specific DNA-methyltransferase (adenine-specific)